MGNAKKKIFIACAADINYARPVAVMLISLLENLDKSYSAEIKILDSGIRSEDQKKISVALNKYNCVFEFIPVQTEQFKYAIGENAHLSTTTYARLLLPDLFPNVEKIIYLDGDLIVRGDIARLWETDLTGKMMAAASLLFPFYYDLLGEIFKISAVNGYFNAGVMVMNLKKMRETGFVRKAIDFIVANQGRLTNVADQDVLNVLLGDDFTTLALRWNVAVESYVGRGYENTAAAQYGFYSRTEFLSAQADPQIIHFDGALKPWHFGFFHPYHKLYDYYLARTPFAKNKIFDVKKLFFFYAYYCLKFLPALIYRRLLPLLKKIYKRKNFRPRIK